jgi:hypothetical protein
VTVRQLLEQIQLDFTGWAQVVLGVLTIGLTIILFLRSRRETSISWSTLQIRPLLINSRFPLTVEFAGEAVTSPNLIVWRIANSGNQSIHSTAFEGPIEVCFEQAQVLSFDTTASRPDPLPVKLTKKYRDRIIIEPPLLNPRDMFEVQVLATCKPKSVQVSGRVAGVTQFQQIRLPKDSWGRTWRYSRFDKTVLLVLPLLLGVSGIGRQERRGAARGAVNVAVWLRRANGWITIACVVLIPISSGPAGSTRCGSSR